VTPCTQGIDRLIDVLEQICNWFAVQGEIDLKYKAISTCPRGPPDLHGALLQTVLPQGADMATLTRVQPGEWSMSLGTILLIILILILIGVIPTWPHSREWGYAPGGIVGVILIVLLILLLMGRI
jgi:hypothetical protein